jgi:hypothetical protein
MVNQGEHPDLNFHKMGSQPDKHLVLQWKAARKHFTWQKRSNHKCTTQPKEITTLIQYLNRQGQVINTS